MKQKSYPNALFFLAAWLMLALPLAGRAQLVFTTSGGIATITGYTGTNPNVVIPAVTNGYPVKSIGSSAFSQKTNLFSVTIPNSVTSIGSRAFQSCSGLTSVILPNSLTNIGTYAFYACSSLTSVTIPASVTRIGDHAFGYCFFLSTAYFQGNAPLVNSGAGSVDNTVFYGLNYSYNYQEAGIVYYPPGTTGWGTNFGSWPTVCTSNTTPISVFAFVTNNGSITITGYAGTNIDVILPGTISGYPVTAIGNAAFSNQYYIRSMLLPNSITSIGNQAFYYCDSLLSLPLPSNLTSIGDQAFQYCVGVTYMTVPSGVTNIGSGAFLHCDSLLNISVVAGNPNYASLGGVLFDSAITTLIQFPAALAGSYTVPNSVTNIGSGSFYTFNSSLTSVTIPKSVLNIADSAFSLCYYVSSFTVAADNPNYTSVEGVLFDKAQSTLIRYPTSLNTNYMIPNGVTRIGESAFQAATGLNSLVIPNSVTTIGSNALLYCISLTNIAVGAANPNYASTGGVLFNQAMTTLIQYPLKLAGGYAIPNGVTRIGDTAFDDCSALTSVTIPGSVTDIGGNAFTYCYQLTSITIPGSVTNIGQQAFIYCSGLHQAYFQGSAPLVNGGPGSADVSVFQGESGTAFYPPGATGWGGTFGGWPATAGAYQPQPQVVGTGPGLGGQTNGFSFTIFWATNTAVVVEASTNLLNWTPVITNTLVNGIISWGDSNWTNYPQRFYRGRAL